MKVNDLKKEILQFDVKDILIIIKKNIFLILFFTLLSMIIGYFDIIKNSNTHKFDINIKVPSANYKTKETLKDISDNLYKIAILDKEHYFIQHLIKTNSELPIFVNCDWCEDNIHKAKGDYLITVNYLDVLISDILKNLDLNDEVTLNYNEKVKKDFLNDTDQKEYIIDNKPTYVSQPVDQISSIRIIFSQNYSDYLVENYVKVFLNTINDRLYQTVINKINKTMISSTTDRLLLQHFVEFAIIKYPKELHYFTTNFSKFDSINEYGKSIKATGIYEKNIDLFNNSTNIDDTFKDKYAVTFIGESKNRIIWYGILGFLIGVILSFSFNLYYKNRNIK